MACNAAQLVVLLFSLTWGMAGTQETPAFNLSALTDGNALLNLLSLGGGTQMSPAPAAPAPATSWLSNLGSLFSSIPTIPPPPPPETWMSNVSGLFPNTASSATAVNESGLNSTPGSSVAANISMSPFPTLLQNLGSSGRNSSSEGVGPYAGRQVNLNLWPNATATNVTFPPTTEAPSGSWWSNLGSMISNSWLGGSNSNSAQKSSEPEDIPSPLVNNSENDLSGHILSSDSGGFNLTSWWTNLTEGATHDTELLQFLSLAVNHSEANISGRSLNPEFARQLNFNLSSWWANLTANPDSSAGNLLLNLWSQFLNATASTWPSAGPHSNPIHNSSTANFSNGEEIRPEFTRDVHMDSSELHGIDREERRFSKVNSTEQGGYNETLPFHNKSVEEVHENNTNANLTDTRIARTSLGGEHIVDGNFTDFDLGIGNFSFNRTVRRSFEGNSAEGNITELDFLDTEREKNGTDDSSESRLARFGLDHIKEVNSTEVESSDRLARLNLEVLNGTVGNYSRIVGNSSNSIDRLARFENNTDTFVLDVQENVTDFNSSDRLARRHMNISVETHNTTKENSTDRLSRQDLLDNETISESNQTVLAVTDEDSNSSSASHAIAIPKDELNMSEETTNYNRSDHARDIGNSTGNSSEPKVAGFTISNKTVFVVVPDPDVNNASMAFRSFPLVPPNNTDDRSSNSSADSEIVQANGSAVNSEITSTHDENPEGSRNTAETVDVNSQTAGKQDTILDASHTSVKASNDNSEDAKNPDESGNTAEAVGDAKNSETGKHDTIQDESLTSVKASNDHSQDAKNPGVSLRHDVHEDGSSDLPVNDTEVHVHENEVSEPSKDSRISKPANVTNEAILREDLDSNFTKNDSFKVVGAGSLGGSTSNRTTRTLSFFNFESGKTLFPEDIIDILSESEIPPPFLSISEKEELLNSLPQALSVSKESKDSFFKNVVFNITSSLEGLSEEDKEILIKHSPLIQQLETLPGKDKFIILPPDWKDKFTRTTTTRPETTSTTVPTTTSEPSTTTKQPTTTSEPSTTAKQPITSKPSTTTKRPYRTTTKRPYHTTHAPYPTTKRYHPHPPKPTHAPYGPNYGVQPHVPGGYNEIQEIQQYIDPDTYQPNIVLKGNHHKYEDPRRGGGYSHPGIQFETQEEYNTYDDLLHGKERGPQVFQSPENGHRYHARNPAKGENDYVQLPDAAGTYRVGREMSTNLEGDSPQDLPYQAAPLDEFDQQLSKF